MHAEGAGSQALTLQSCTPTEAFTGGSFQVSLGALDGRKLPFSVDVSLDSGTGDSLGHLPQHYEAALESDLIQSDKDFASRDEYCNYLNHLTGADIDSALPSISLSCTLAGTYLDLPISTTGPLTVAGEIGKIGSYQWRENEDGNLELTVTLDRYIYACTDVAFDEIFELQLKDGVRAEAGPPSLQLGEEKLIAVLGLTDRADPAAQYKLTKTAPAAVDTPTIPYTITAELQPEAGGSLAGTVLWDRLPEGLTLAGAAATPDGAGPIGLSESDYSLTGGVFTYAIPEKAAEQRPSCPPTTSPPS